MEKSFEEAIGELEQVVKVLQNGELSLDDSMKQFKNGVELANLCNKKLEEAEKSIKILVEKPNSEVVEEDFNI